jgi:nitroreductase
MMKIDEFTELVHKRRSIRRLKPDPIPDEWVEKILECGRWAMSGGNAQPWEFIVIKNKELRDRIAEIAQEQYGITHKMEMLREPKLRFPKYTTPPTGKPGFATAPVFILPCGDTRTKEIYPKSMTMTISDSIFITTMAKPVINTTCDIGINATFSGSTSGGETELIWTTYPDKKDELSRSMFTK